MFFKNASWMLLEKILRLGLGLISSIIVARQYSTNDFGLFVFAQGVISLLSAVTNVGIPNVLIKDLVGINMRNKVKRLSDSFKIQFIGAFFSFAIVIAYIYFSEMDEVASAVLCIIAVSNFIMPFSLVENNFIADQQIQKLIPFYMIIYILFFSVKLWVSLNGLSIVIFSIVYSVELVLLYLCPFILFCIKNEEWYSFSRRILKLEKCTNYIKRLFKLSYPIALAGLVYSLYMRADLIIIEHLSTTYVLALYGAAVKLCDPLVVFAGVITTAAFPLLVNAKYQGNYEFIRALRKLIVITTLISISLVAIVNLNSEFLINILFGEKYSGAASILSIYSYSILFFFFGSIFGKVLIINNLQRYLILPLIIACALKVLVSFVILKDYSFEYIGYSTVAASLIANLLGFLIFKETRGVMFSIIRGQGHAIKESH